MQVLIKQIEEKALLSKEWRINEPENGTYPNNHCNS